jgi:hypothetical protein
MVGSASTLGMALGPAAGGFDDATASYVWLYLGALGIGAMAIALALRPFEIVLAWDRWRYELQYPMEF